MFATKCEYLAATYSRNMTQTYVVNMARFFEGRDVLRQVGLRHDHLPVHQRRVRAHHR